MSSPSQPNGPRFVTPAGYPTRVTDDLIVSIASEVMAGVSPYTAAALYGINRHTFTRWLAWGRVAVDEGGDDRHRHAPYIQLFLTITQAHAIAQSGAEKAMYQMYPERWLATHPIARIDWNPNFAGTVSALEETPQELQNVVDANKTDEAAGPPMQLPPGDLRKMLKTLIDAGVARQGTPDTLDSTNVVDADEDSAAS